MKILYVSVHAVLEDDEVRLFKSLGHEVFTLGVNFGFGAVEPFRESIAFSDGEKDFLGQFHAMGCSYRYGAAFADEVAITAEFVALFDVVVVMHDLVFIEKFWDVLSLRPVIWRTIGQNIDGCEADAADLKARGMEIVRYSPVERHAVGYCGETALIRFAKNPHEFLPWSGRAAFVLTFCNALSQRYPVLADLYRDMVDGFPTVLGGFGNEGLPGNAGILSPRQQADHYSAGRAYLYCSGAEIPYTLNFMEALMAGMPVVAADFPPTHRFYEIPSLLDDGAGIVVQTVDDGRRALTALLEDESYARSVSEKARARGIELFSTDHIGPQWDRLFRTLT